MTPASPPTAMKTPVLSTVYVDSRRIGLMGDPKPMVAKVVAASGREPAEVQVARSRSPATLGTPVQLEDIIDRTAEPAKAIYLTCQPRAGAPAAVPHSITWPMIIGPTPAVRGPLPEQPAAVEPRPAPAPGGTQGDGEGPEWGAKKD